MRNYHTFRLWGLSFRWRPWALCAGVLMIALIILLAATSIGMGDYPMPLLDVLRVLAGGSRTRMEELVVLHWRLPRAIGAIVVGMLLGLSGALMQTMTRNQLASPDILGITMGASLCVVFSIVLGLGWSIPMVALLGGLATGLVLWLAAWRTISDPLRVVLFGIIVTALCQAAIYYLMARANINDASVATFWLHGSLGQVQWGTLMPAVITLALVVPLLAPLTFRLQALNLGPELAGSLGRNYTHHQWLLLFLAIVSASVAIAATGPIGFIAFVAPHLARGVFHASAPPLAGSALLGAVVLSAADSAIQAVPVELPVGVITSAIGGTFLLYLLVSSQRKGVR